ncbi:hypothetical protein BYT27DRAFT_7249623 [Phlegmacium glaucopus]|nr:hypothetical protein BYT27DRAFT_7249623 [Phlegmacium glaucopus]
MPSKPSSKVTSPSKKINPSLKASDSPGKKITTMIKTETSEVDIKAFLTTDRSPGVSKKRKSHPVIISSDSSDVELLEGPTTPLKKCLRKTPPPPGSEAFNLLEAVSASHILASAMSGAGSTTPRVEFGSVVIDNDIRPKRVIVKTEKAKAIEAVTKMPSCRPLKPSAVQSLTAGKSSTSTATKAYMEPAPADAESFSLVELSDDDIPDMAQYGLF